MRFIKASVLVAGAFLCLIALGAWSVSRPSVAAEPFSRPIWLHAAALASDVGDQGCIRGAMALDLVETKRAVGLAMADVAALLGTPARHGPEWSYALGQCSGFGWSHSALVVRFDGGGRSLEARFKHAP